MRTRADIKKEDKTLADLYNGFKKIGYQYFGTWYWRNKNINAYIPKEIEEYFNNTIGRIETEIYGSRRFYLNDLDIWPTCGHKDPSYILTQLLADGNKENICKIQEPEKTNADGSKKKSMYYYCFWNSTKKYYYLINLSSQSFGRYSSSTTECMFKAFDYWLTLRSQAPECFREFKEEMVIQKAAEDLAKKQEEERRKQYEEEQRIRKEKEEKENAMREEIKEIENKIKEDAEKHPEKYKEITWQTLPDNIRKQINERDLYKEYENEYFEYGTIIEYGRYDDGLKRFYVNNRDLTDGYTYTSWVSWAKPGTYWGD